MNRDNWWYNPLGVAVATIIIGTIVTYFGYSIDRELHHVDGRFDAIDSHIADFDSRLTCVLQKTIRCCPEDGNNC